MIYFAYLTTFKLCNYYPAIVLEIRNFEANFTSYIFYLFKIFTSYILHPEKIIFKISKIYIEHCKVCVR